jgi:hypothetical protein
MALYTSTSPSNDAVAGTVHSLDAVASSGHAVPGAAPGAFYRVFRCLGDPNVIFMLPPVGLGAKPVIYTVKSNFPTFTPWVRPDSDKTNLAIAEGEEIFPEVIAPQEEVFVRRNKPVFARFRR